MGRTVSACMYFQQVSAAMCASGGGVFIPERDGPPRGSLCAGVSLERQTSGADIPRQLGSGRSFIQAEIVLALHFWRTNPGAMSTATPSCFCQCAFLLHLVFTIGFSLIFMSSSVTTEKGKVEYVLL